MKRHERPITGGSTGDSKDVKDKSHFAFLTDSDYLLEYKIFLAEDAGVEAEAESAYNQMCETPYDHFDKVPKKFDDLASDAIVGRRAPLNPLASPKLGKFRMGQTKGPKVEDPALEENPLRGRLVVTLNTSFILLFVFLQSLVANYIKFGKFHAPKSANSMLGPQGETLHQLGGLDTNLIRAGETVRLFWAMWMHSGWIHIGLNVVSQLQFFYMFEPDWGFWRTFFLFWLSGVSGNLMSANADPCSVTVGSSGGLYGLMGAMIVYCIEFWHSIPRPCCILIFTLIVVIISFITGFTGNTDNWAHLGGLLGGLLFCLGTITTFSCQGCCCSKKQDKTVSNLELAESKAGVFISPDGVKKKKKLKRVALGGVGRDIPRCRCGIEEWTTRIVAWALLFGLWFGAVWCLWRAYEYQPPGHVTFSGVAKCQCCYKKPPKTIATWYCAAAETALPFGISSAMGDVTGNWGKFCDDQLGKRRRLEVIESSLHEIAQEHPLAFSAVATESSRALSHAFSDALSYKPVWLNVVPPAVVTTGAMTSIRSLRGLTSQQQIGLVSNHTESQRGNEVEQLLNEWIRLTKSEATATVPHNRWTTTKHSWLQHGNSPLPIPGASFHKD